MKKLKLREADLAWRSIEDEVVVVDVRSSTYLATNDAGTRLWARLGEGATRDELVAELVDTWGIDVETAGADVDRFLDQLRRRALLEDETVS